MANLDLSEIIDDPDFADEFIVVQQNQIINNQGRQTTMRGEPEDAWGSMQPAGDETYQQFPDLTRMEGTLDCFTRATLRMKGATHAPDIVLWQDREYLVVARSSYAHFGAGWVRAVLQLREFVEA